MAANDGKLPLNVRVIFEGEEEVGGEGIATFVRRSPPSLKADFALVSDTETVCAGFADSLRRTARHDLHRARSERLTHRPPFRHLWWRSAQSVCRAGADHLQVQGRQRTYPDSRVSTTTSLPPSAAELAAWKSLPFDEEKYRVDEVGSKQLVGEAGYSVLERTWARPTLDVHGMPGGFTGAGAKTVIPGQGNGQSVDAAGSRT